MTTKNEIKRLLIVFFAAAFTYLLVPSYVSLCPEHLYNYLPDYFASLWIALVVFVFLWLIDFIHWANRRHHPPQNHA